MTLKVVSTLSALSLLALAACAPKAATDQDMTIVDASGPTQCHAEDWQSYVGKPRSSLPQAPQGMSFRVACDTCAVTMDYRSNRVTFVYDDKNVITRATCR